jgi:hypothetical protein
MIVGRRFSVGRRWGWNFLRVRFVKGDSEKELELEEEEGGTREISELFALMLRTSVSRIMEVGGVDGGVRISNPSWKFRLLLNFLFNSGRGLSGGERGNILSRVELMGVDGPFVYWIMRGEPDTLDI